ncbi:MAG: ribonuclease P protein component [Clostridiales bacterium]|nr:ribonuclease P protein component [Clostridiales bacterium]
MRPLLRSLPLRFNYEFSRVYRRGGFATGRYLTVHVFRRPSGLKHNNTIVPPDVIRVGFCANKKQLGAVGRNRARRLMRESFRQIENKIRPGSDIVITLRSVPQVPTYQEIDSEIKRHLRKLDVLYSEN